MQISEFKASLFYKQVPGQSVLLHRETLSKKKNTKGGVTSQGLPARVLHTQESRRPAPCGCCQCLLESQVLFLWAGA